MRLPSAGLPPPCDPDARTGAPRFVAGVLGPTNRTASLSPDVNDPGFRNIGFDDLVATYRDAATNLIRGGADFILVDTDPLQSTPAQIRATKVLETWVGGERAYVAK